MQVDIATIHACHRRVYALAYRYTDDPEEALDLPQEVFDIMPPVGPTVPNAP
jgi:DNA-directed RNA polymerase specialized sigma24 family protein